MLDQIYVDMWLFGHKYLQEVPIAFITMNNVCIDIMYNVHTLSRNMDLYVVISTSYFQYIDVYLKKRTFVNRFQGTKLT